MVMAPPVWTLWAVMAPPPLSELVCEMCATCYYLRMPPPCTMSSYNSNAPTLGSIILWTVLYDMYCTLPSVSQRVVTLQNRSHQGYHFGQDADPGLQEQTILRKQRHNALSKDRDMFTIFFKSPCIDPRTNVFASPELPEARFKNQLKRNQTIIIQMILPYTSWVWAIAHMMVAYWLMTRGGSRCCQTWLQSPRVFLSAEAHVCWPLQHLPGLIEYHPQQLHQNLIFV